MCQIKVVITNEAKENVHTEVEREGQVMPQIAGETTNNSMDDIHPGGGEGGEHVRLWL
jgi:hypothetical protein